MFWGFYLKTIPKEEKRMYHKEAVRTVQMKLNKKFCCSKNPNSFCKLFFKGKIPISLFKIFVQDCQYFLLLLRPHLLSDSYLTNPIFMVIIPPWLICLSLPTILALEAELQLELLLKKKLNWHKIHHES